MPSSEGRFLQACRRVFVDCTPVWIMRQAGRYLPAYRAVRDRVTFLELCKRPELAAQVTVEARDILGTDAAILFADLLPLLEPMGFHLEYQQGEGPVIHNPLRMSQEVSRVRELEDVTSLDYVYQAIRLIRRALPPEVALLGFAGAPFTLASYVIEGGGSRSYHRTKQFMYSFPGAWRDLMERLARSVSRYLTAQLQAGCHAVQLFDSWVGCLGPRDYEEYVLPYSRMVLQSVTSQAPVIHFVTGNPALLSGQQRAGGSVMGLDWRMELAVAWQVLGADVPVQGNLDPAVLLADWPTVKSRVSQLLESVAGRTGHIFNLGHGVLPETPWQMVRDVVRFVHDYSAELWQRHHAARGKDPDSTTPSA
ncbi:MAG: hypothetical protein KatS3mg113_1027 [Planctomycetaceae bacterium]|nr:MAG: hypothetical protein KatS3mg113_1027 [Planctomycetaceae bacterium]